MSSSLLPVVLSAFSLMRGLPAGVTVAVRLCDLVSPLKNALRCATGTGRRLPWRARGKSFGRAGGVREDRAAVAPAVVTREGQVRAAGSRARTRRSDRCKDWLDAKAGPGVIDAIAGRAVLDGDS